MKIGIISDSHDNIGNTRKAIQKIEKLGCETLIHCGDFCAPFMIKEISNFSGDVHCCFGNTNDKYFSLKIANENNVNLHGDYGEIKINNKKIAFTHYPFHAEGLASLEKYDLVCHGHNHKAKKEKRKNTWLVNPGELLGFNRKPSFAIYDTKTDEIEIIKL